MKKPMPPKARELTIFGIAVGACSIAWLAAPDAGLLAQGFTVAGAGAIGYALYLWRRSDA